jgi:FkbM family methyltransferase
MDQKTQKSHLVLIRGIQALATVIVVLTIARFVWPVEVMATALHLAGISDAPTLAESVEAVRTRKTIDVNAAELSKTSYLVEKDPKGLELWETGQGRYWIPSPAAMMQLYDMIGEQNTDIYGSGESSVHAGDVVLDCGASVGLYTRKALDSGAKLVVAIEPSPRSVECLRRNFEKEIHEGRVVVAPIGVWDKEDFLVLEMYQEGEWGDTFKSKSAERTKTDGPHVRVTTIDTLVAELNLPRVDFVKMDIEGAEKEALAGASATILRDKPRLALCTYHLPGDPVAIPKLIGAYNLKYRTQSLYEYQDGRLRGKVVRFF